MTENLSPSATASREASRTAGGQFGTQPRTEADLDLDAGVPAGPRIVALPDPRDDRALRDFVTVEVARHRQDLHGGDQTVHYDGDAIISDLKGEAAGGRLTEHELGELFEHHQYLDPDDYEWSRPTLVDRLLGRPRVPQPRADVQPTWP